MVGVGEILTRCPDGKILPPLQPVSAHYSHLTSSGALWRSGHNDAKLLTGGTICQAEQSRGAEGKGELRGPTWEKGSCSR